MRRVAVLVLGVALLATCSGHGDSGADGVPVRDSQLPAAEVVPTTGPAYVEQVLTGRARTLVRTPAHTTRLAGPSDVTWRADGTALVVGDRGARLLDPTTGAWRSQWVPVGEYGLTPDALTTVRSEHPDRVVVYDAALGHRRIIQVPAAKAETDQLGEDAEFHLHGRAYTLGGVTFVEWGVNSEDDTRTDHGLFRIEGDVISQALRNEPLVRLWPSTDGSALLAVIQDNGEAEDCGGCTVEQEVVELDPGTGEVAADYGMPPGYARSWRISALDKVGTTVVVQFVVRSGESGGAYQTWTYDGSWRRLAAAGDTRTRFQVGGAMAWAGDTGNQNQPFDLTWTPVSGAPEIIRDRSTPCPPDGPDATACPIISLPGSLLPLG